MSGFPPICTLRPDAGRSFHQAIELYGKVKVVFLLLHLNGHVMLPCTKDSDAEIANVLIKIISDT